MVERGTCPSSLKWLKGMHSVLPPEIFAKSKLAIYLHCIEESEKKEEAQ
jgi:hypothetical protein